MEYEDLIEDESEGGSETAEQDAEIAVKEPRAKSPWKAFILTGFLAGLIGAAGGGFGAYTALKKFSPTPIVPTQIDLAPVEASLKGLNDRLSAAETDLQTLSKRSALDTEPVDLSGLEGRVSALENAPSPEINPDALTALQAAQKDGFEWPDTAALEDRIRDLEAKTKAPVDAPIPQSLMERLALLEAELETFHNAEPMTAPQLDEDMVSDIQARLTALENRPPPTPRVERISILAFPKAQLVTAVEANMEGGMIQKTLSRHIRVKDANDPLTLIEGIEEDLNEGRLTAAAEKFERLPMPVRRAGQAWYESVKASL